MVKNIFISYFLFNSTVAVARELILLEPKDVSIEALQYQSMHDPYLSPIDKDIAYGAAFNTDLNVFRYGDIAFYWTNKLHFDQSKTNGHIKHAGWQYEFGIPLWVDKGSSKIELFQQHHSRHVLEETRADHFPVYDRIGIRIRLLP